MTTPKVHTHISVDGKDYIDTNHMSVEWFNMVGRDEISLTIDKVCSEEATTPNGRTEANKLVLRFRGVTQDIGLVMNATNIKRLARIAGSSKTDDWVGVEITLNLEIDKLFGGGKGDTLRIKQAPLNPTGGLK